MRSTFAYVAGLRLMATCSWYSSASLGEGNCLIAADDAAAGLRPRLGAGMPRHRVSRAATDLHLRLPCASVQKAYHFLPFLRTVPISASSLDSEKAPRLIGVGAFFSFPVVSDAQCLRQSRSADMATCSAQRALMAWRTASMMISPRLGRPLSQAPLFSAGDTRTHSASRFFSAAISAIVAPPVLAFNVDGDYNGGSP